MPCATARCSHLGRGSSGSATALGEASFRGIHVGYRRPVLGSWYGGADQQVPGSLGRAVGDGQVMGNSYNVVH